MAGALAVIAAATGITASALAINLGDAGGVSYRYQAKHAGANQTADSVAKCPKGKVPAGGGYQLSADMGLSQFDVATSKPFDGPDAGDVPDDGWEVRGQTTQGATASSYADCVKGELRYPTSAHNVFGPSRVKAMCPGNHWHVTGGGGGLGKPASSILLASYPIDGDDANTKPDDGWEAWAYAQPEDQLRAFAVCSRKKPVYHQMTASLDPGRGSRLTAMCGDGHHLLGVGGKLGDAPVRTAVIQLAEPNDFDRDQVYDDSGAAFAVNDLGAPTAAEGTAYAICTR